MRADAAWSTRGRIAARVAGALLAIALGAGALGASAQRRKTPPPPPALPPVSAEPVAPAVDTEQPSDTAAGADPAEDAAPAAAPAASAQPTPATEDEAEPTEDLAALQAELAQVMDDLVQARARVALLGKSLWKTRVRVRVDNRAAPDQIAARAALYLDGAPIWSGDGAQLRDPERVLFDGFAAPGPHVLTLEIAQRSRDDEAFRYDLRESYRFQAPRERRTDLRLVIDDDSDMAEDFPDDEEGSYEVQTRLEARAVALDDE
jgi:hypothetical protein